VQDLSWAEIAGSLAIWRESHNSYLGAETFNTFKQFKTFKSFQSFEMHNSESEGARLSLESALLPISKRYLATRLT
jgi:hypothetical protein